MHAEAVLCCGRPPSGGLIDGRQRVHDALHSAYVALVGTGVRLLQVERLIDLVDQASDRQGTVGGEMMRHVGHE